MPRAPRTAESPTLYPRSLNLPEVMSAEGCWMTDADGKRYLDGSSGALVVNIGHGDPVVISKIAEQAARVAYTHPTMFTTAVGEEYAGALAARLPMADPSIYPVSGGSEAVETALKLARAYHLARGDESRHLVLSRELSYHGNTRGALAVSGRKSLRDPYLPWLGQGVMIPAALEYRCGNPEHPTGCGDWHVSMLRSTIDAWGAENIAAFIAEPVGGAASGAAVPPEGYWSGMADVCRENGILVIADEVMTGFGRTGRWFASEHFGLEPDVMVMAKGASSGYWPLGICAMSAEVAETVGPANLVHGFTFSHHPVGAAVGLAVLEQIESQSLVHRAERSGKVLAQSLSSALGSHPHVGDIRGIGLLLAIELVANRQTGDPFDSEMAAATRVASAARDHGLLVYPSTGTAGEGRGDVVMVGPPLTISDDEIATLTDRLSRAVESLW